MFWRVLANIKRTHLNLRREIEGKMLVLKTRKEDCGSTVEAKHISRKLGVSLTRIKLLIPGSCFEIHMTTRHIALDD